MMRAPTGCRNTTRVNTSDRLTTLSTRAWSGYAGPGARPVRRRRRLDVRRRGAGGRAVRAVASHRGRGAAPPRGRAGAAGVAQAAAVGVAWGPVLAGGGVRARDRVDEHRVLRGHRPAAARHGRGDRVLRPGGRRRGGVATS